MDNLKDLVAMDKPEQMNTLYCLFCCSTKVHPVVGKDIKCKNKYPPYQEIKIPSIDGLYCPDCKTAYAIDKNLDDVIQKCRNISGDLNFYPSEIKEKIDV